MTVTYNFISLDSDIRIYKTNLAMKKRKERGAIVCQCVQVMCSPEWIVQSEHNTTKNVSISSLPSLTVTVRDTSGKDTAGASGADGGSSRKQGLAKLDFYWSC